MLKTKDGYAKVIGTSYQGSSDYLLLSNGDSKAISSLSVNYATSAGNADTLDGAHLNGIFTAFGNDENNISATVGGVTKKFEVKYSNHSYYSRFIKGDDQRNANNAPSYYMNTFGYASLYTEFSQQGKQFGNGTYVNLITSTPWRDSGGGRPAQLAIGNYIGLRSAANDSTWGAWRTIPTIDANGVMEIGKFIDWHWNNEIYGSQDFSTRLQAQNTSSYPNTVYLPTQSGELALLDQVELSQYHVVDMRNYDSGYWHPVTVGLPKRGYNKIKVSVELNIGDKPSWATHSDGFTCNMEIWATAHGWGTTNAGTICLNYTYGHCNSNPCGWKQLGYPSLGVLFLRGGARYKVWTDFDATFTPHDKTYTWTSENGGYTQSTGGPYTSCPGLDFIKNRIYANLDGSASYLEGGSTPSWGTLTAANGFTNVSSYDYGSRGAYGLCGKNTALYMQLDGYFYQNEGKYRVIDTSDFNWTNLPGKLAGNEFNIVNAGFNNRMWFNYLPIDNRNSSAAISQYIMGNGNKGLASVYAYRFKVDGKSCMWKDARNYAPFYATFNGGFEPILDIKTVSGDWSIGSYDSTGNSLIFSFTSDSDFNAGVNGTAWYYITTGGTFSGASKYINHTPGDPQSYMHSTSTGTYGGAIQIREVNEVLNNQSAWGYAPRITFHWGQRYAKGFGMRSDGQFAVDDVPIALTSNVLTFDNDNADYLGANFNNPDFSKKAASKYIECWDGAGGWWNWMAGKFMKAGSSDAYVLLGGGGHKPLSEFQLGSGSYLPYNGWWGVGSGQDVNNANGMIFAYANHKNSPFSSAWGIITTFDYTYNSDYKFQLAANGYSNAMYYRSRSADRGGWTSWAQVIDTGNISSQTVDKSYHLRVNHSVSTNSTWSTWYWIGQSGQPTWLWGTNDGINCYVWNPSNFSVKYATSAGSVSNSLNIFGVSYNGSAAKTVTTSTFVSQLPEATGTVTDGTMFITSWASDNGFADTNAVNVPYKRKAIHLWEYIKAKTDSLYTTKGHNHDDRYLKLTGGIMTGTINRRSGGSTISGRDHAIIRQTYAPGGSSWNPIACVDTETGTWTLGHLSSGDSDTNFHFCFSTNADYNAGNNNGNYVTLRNKVGTIALLSEIPDKNSWNYDDRYLKLTGGTMTGTIRFNNLINIDSAIVLDYKYSAGGFARDIVSMKNSVYGDANLGALSILCYPNSTSNGFQYIYLGTDKYYGPNNLRIYKDKVTFGDNILIDAGNIGSQSVAYASKAGNADTVDGYHANSLLTALSNSNNGISITVGGTTKSVSNISVNYAASAGSASSATQATNLTPENTPHYFRDPSSSAWRGGMYWGNAGNESMSFVVGDSRTRFQFVGGSDIANWTSSTWQSVTPYLTIYSSGIVTPGSVTANNWFRSQGASGWYSETYGGGIYMTDTSWIRTYGDKPFYCDNQIYSSNSIRMSNIYLQNIDEINNGANGALHLNYRNSGNITLCNGGGAVTIGTTSTDIGGNKLYVNGSEFINGASNVKDHVFANGFRHRSHNSNDSVLLAGGGYSQGVPVRYWAIYSMYIGNSSTDVTYTKRSGNYNFITSEAWESEGAARFDISFPSGYNKNNTLIFGNGDHRTSSSWKTPVYVTITTSTAFGGASQIRVMISDDASLNVGFANIYFMCMG